MNLLTFLVFAAFCAVGVRSHGYVQDVVIGSTHYTGYLPYTDPYYNPPPQRVIRQIPGNGTRVPYSLFISYSMPYLGPVTDLSLIE